MKLVRHGKPIKNQLVEVVINMFATTEIKTIKNAKEIQSQDAIFVLSIIYRMRSKTFRKKHGKNSRKRRGAGGPLGLDDFEQATPQREPIATLTPRTMQNRENAIVGAPLTDEERKIRIKAIQDTYNPPAPEPLHIMQRQLTPTGQALEDAEGGVSKEVSPEQYQDYLRSQIIPPHPVGPGGVPRRGYFPRGLMRPDAPIVSDIPEPVEVVKNIPLRQLTPRTQQLSDVLGGKSRRRNTRKARKGRKSRKNRKSRRR